MRQAVANIPNRCLSAATSCLYGITEAAVLAAGYAPAVGFIHTGKPLSFVYDIADLFKFDTVVPLAFKIASKSPGQPEKDVRLACRDIFRSSKLLGRIIPMIENVLSSGGILPPETPPESVPPAIPNPEGIGEAGHRILGRAFLLWLRKTFPHAFVVGLLYGFWRYELAYTSGTFLGALAK